MNLRGKTGSLLPPVEKVKENRVLQDFGPECARLA